MSMVETQPGLPTYNSLLSPRFRGVENAGHVRFFQKGLLFLC